MQFTFPVTKLYYFLKTDNRWLDVHFSKACQCDKNVQIYWCFEMCCSNVSDRRILAIIAHQNVVTIFNSKMLTTQIKFLLLK